MDGGPLRVAEAPMCLTHNRAMKRLQYPTKQGHQWHCTAKMGDDWCEERAKTRIHPGRAGVFVGSGLSTCRRHVHADHCRHHDRFPSRLSHRRLARHRAR